MKTPFCRFYTTLLVLLFSTGLALGQTSAEFVKLPPEMQALIAYEQKYLSREVDEMRIRSPKENFQDPKYAPESEAVFFMKGYWLSEKLFFVENADAAQEVNTFTRISSAGEREVLFLVHPESEEYFKELTAQSRGEERFFATSTSSSRTLVAWQDPSKPFFAKVSLAKEIGGVVRTIPKGEVARSVGTTMVLRELRQQLPQNFDFLPEVFGLMPKNMDRGGMIVREGTFPGARPGNRLAPLFSLYAPPRGGGKPIILEMIAKSGQTPEDFIRSRLIEPFAQQWVDLTCRFGVSMEPHAQNVLVELDAQGMPTGKFVHRDLGGFNVNLGTVRKKYSVKTNELPRIDNLVNDYHQMHHEKSINQSLHVYYSGGFLFNLANLMRQEQLIRNATPALLDSWLKEALANQFATILGSKPQIGHLLQISGLVERARGVLKTSALCEESALAAAN